MTRRNSIQSFGAPIIPDRPTDRTTPPWTHPGPKETEKKVLFGNIMSSPHRQGFLKAVFWRGGIRRRPLTGGSAHGFLRGTLEEGGRSLRPESRPIAGSSAPSPEVISRHGKLCPVTKNCFCSPKTPSPHGESFLLTRNRFCSRGVISAHQKLFLLTRNHFPCRDRALIASGKLQSRAGFVGGPGCATVAPGSG